MKDRLQNGFYYGAAGSLLALIALCVAWELVLAPLRPGGSWLVLKVVPLLLPLRGVLKRDLYTLQWTSMLILLYLAEGVVRATSDSARMSALLGWAEISAGLRLFSSAPCCTCGRTKRPPRSWRKQVDRKSSNPQ